MLPLSFPLPLVDPSLGVEVASAVLEEDGAGFVCCTSVVVCPPAICAALFGVQGDSSPKVPRLDGVGGEKGYFPNEG